MKQITGNFKESGSGSKQSYVRIQPFIKAVVELPKLNLQHPVVFLVDTGAAQTTLHPQSIVHLGIAFDNYVPTRKREMTGVGGAALYGEEEAILHFKTAQVPLSILLGPLDKDQFEVALSKQSPSLLGMDLLSMTRLTVDYVANQLSVAMHPTNSIQEIQHLRTKLKPNEYARHRQRQRDKT